MCGASLIAPRFLASAFHCFYHSEYPNINFDRDCSLPGRCFATIRQHHLALKDIGEQRIDIRSVHQPPFEGGDLAIVDLKEPVSLDERAQLVKVSAERLVKGDLVLTLGWGLAFQRGRPNVLLKAQLTVSEVDRTGDLTFTEVGDNNGIPVDPCRGDSGGPLLAKKDGVGEWLLYATLQGGGYNCQTNKTAGDGAWNSLAPHADWVQEILNIPGENQFCILHEN